MQNIQKAVTVVSLAIVLIIGLERCNNKEQKGPAVSEDKSSELAVYMRDIFSYSLQLKEEVLKDSLTGNKTTYNGDLAFIKNAVPTDHGVKGDLFNAYSDGYLSTVETFYQEQNESNGQIFNYNNMVTACINCHTTFCPGPIKKIKKLYIN